MIIAIDVGNTRIKVAVYEHDAWKSFYHVAAKDFRAQIESIAEKAEKKPIIILSSVGKLNEYQLKWLASKGDLHKIDANGNLPFVNKYGTPATDRKSTRLNSSHVRISYAVFCLKKTID